MMKFVDKLLGLMRDGFNFLGDMLYSLFSFLAKPLSYVYYFFDGVFYFFFQLALVVWKLISIFVALIQFFASIVAGFTRFIGSMLYLDFTKTPVHYPSTTEQGIQTVINLIAPVGLLNVVPLILIAMVWFMFIKKMIGLIGGELRSNA